MPVDHHDHARTRRRAASWSIAVNVFLLTLKAVVGAITGSLALWASAADSLLDLSASSFAYLGVRLGARPPDEAHPYGHEKYESLSSLVQLGLLFVTVGIIVAEAWDRLTGAPAVDAPLLGVGVIVISLAIDLWIARRLKRASAETGGSLALEADALHFTTDVWSNIAVIAGLLAVRFGAPIADPLAALVVAVLVALTALGLLRTTASSLVDAAPDEDTVRRILDVLCAPPEVVDHHTVRARMVGKRIYLDACVELDPELTFQAAHDLTHEIQDQLHAEIDELADAVIHFEPAGHPPHQDERHHAHGFDALRLDDHDHGDG